ncbi:MAG: glycine betaine ABC transporter substrate-binding protein [Desulfococcaceae bacterium]
MPKLSRKIEIPLWIIAFAAIVIAGRMVTTEDAPAPENEKAEDVANKTVRIGYVSWAEGIAMTHLVKVILEDRMGYDVDLTMADPAPIFTSLSERNLDFFLDAWLPLTHQSHMEKYGDVLVDLGTNYEGARIGLVVPEYVPVNTIPEMGENPGRFNGDITGIDSGAGIMEATRKAIEQYNLDMNLLTSSGAAMTASLRDAIQSEEPIVVTGWKPHWKFARWDLKFLKDPKTAYGEKENIHTIARRGISKDLPRVVSFAKNFFLNDQQIGTLMDAMNQSESEAAAARKWMGEHEDLVESWIPATG